MLTPTPPIWIRARWAAGRAAGLAWRVRIEHWGWGPGPALVALGLLLAGVTLPFPLMPPGFRPSAQNNPIWMWPFVWVAFAAPVAGLVWLARHVSIPVALLAGWQLLMTWWWAWQGHGFWALLQTAGGLTIYALAAKLPGRADPWLAGLVFGAAVLQAVHGWIEMAGKAWWLDVTQEHLKGLPHGLLYHPNYFGVFTALAVPVGLALARHLAARGSAWTWATPSLLGAVVMMPLIARSRAGILALAAPIGWLVWEQWQVSGPRLRAWIDRRPFRIPWPSQRRWVLGPAVVLLVILLAWGALALKPGQVLDLGGRQLGWAVAVREFMDWRTDGQWPGGWRGGLWIGAGPGVWKRWAQWPGGRLRSIGVPEWGIREQNAFSGWWQEAFNEYLQTLFELGLVGLGLGLVIVVQVARDARWALGGPRVAEYDYGQACYDVTPFCRAWALVALTAIVLAFVTSLFHHAALAYVVLVAAGRLRHYRAFTVPATPSYVGAWGRGRPLRGLWLPETRGE